MSVIRLTWWRLCCEFVWLLKLFNVTNQHKTNVLTFDVYVDIYIRFVSFVMAIMKQLLFSFSKTVGFESSVYRFMLNNYSFFNINKCVDIYKGIFVLFLLRKSSFFLFLNCWFWWYCFIVLCDMLITIRCI